MREFCVCCDGKGADRMDRAVVVCTTNKKWKRDKERERRRRRRELAERLWTHIKYLSRMYDRHIIIIIIGNSNSSSAETAAVSRWRQKPSDGKTFKVCIMPCCNSATLFFVVFSLCFCYRPEHQNRSIFNHDINAMGDSFFCIVPRDRGIDDICAAEFHLNLLFKKKLHIKRISSKISMRFSSLSFISNESKQSKTIPKWQNNGIIFELNQQNWNHLQILGKHHTSSFI